MIINDRIGTYLATGRSWNTRNVNTIKKFSIHHDAIPQDNRTADQVMSSIFRIHHEKNGWPGMSYHYYVHSDGTVYQVNKHEWITWIDGINLDAIGIVLNGYFHSPHNNSPTPPQLKSLKELLDKLCTQHPEFPASQKDVTAHRERGQTACPGDKAYPYIKEYRDKLGDVNWASPPQPQPGNQVPEYLKTMLQEQQLDINNESQMRAFFQKAIDFADIKKDRDNLATKNANALRALN